MDSYLKELDELIADRTLSDSQVIALARTFIAELEKKIAIKDKIIKQLDDYSDNFLSFDVEGAQVLTCVLDSLDDVMNFFRFLKEVSHDPDRLHLYINNEEVDIETAHIKSTDSVRFEAINSSYKIEEIITSLNFVKEF